jgi:hypothetical protein
MGGQERKMGWWTKRSLILAIVIFAPLGAAAQTPAPPAAAPSSQLLNPDALEQLVAPIALYPDPLLAEVLMASTYPLEVVQAERWAEASKNLKGDQLKAAADKQAWDDSVKSLVATPDVLAMMSTKLDWTQKLGDAVLAQQPDVMDAVQRLRAKAQTNNKLTSTKEQSVTVTQVQNRQVIAIEPTDPNTVYVPYYDPTVVYGGWPYPNYPPYYFPPPGYIGAGIIATGIAFGAGYALGRWASGGNYWGGGVNWGGNNLTVNRPININNGGTNWKPRVEHRQGVSNRRGSAQQRDFRGRGGQQVLKPGGGRASVADHKRAAPHAKAGDRSGRPSAVTRPSRGASASHHGASARQHGPSRAATVRSQHGRASAGGGAHRGGGGAHRSGRGGGRRSDLKLKHDVTLLGYLDNGLVFYRFGYNGSIKATTEV